MSFIYRVVGVNGTEEFESVDALLSKYEQVGVMRNTGIREELKGQPKLSGLLGAMYDGTKNGVPVIRYETRAAYELLSV